MAGFAEKRISISAPAGAVRGLAFSPDEQRLAVAHSGGLRLYESFFDWLVAEEPSGVDGAALCVAYGRGQDFIAVGSDGSAPLTVFFYNWGTMEWEAISIEGQMPGAEVRGVAFSPDGNTLAVASSAAPYLHLFDTGSFDDIEAGPVSFPAGAANAVRFSPDGSLLVVGHAGGDRLTIYDTSDWSVVSGPAAPPAGEALALTFSPAGDELLVGHSDGAFLSRYAVSDWSALAALGVPPVAPVTAIAFSASGGIVGLACTDPARGALAYSYPELHRLPSAGASPGADAAAIAFWPGGDVMAVGSGDSPYLHLYDFTPVIEWPVAVVVPSDDVSLPWPVSVALIAAWPVEVQSPAQQVALPWRVSVGAQVEAQSAWPVHVLDPAVIGGLNGAGGWSASPDGRWLAVAVLDDATDISARLTGAVRVEIAEGAARTAEFTFLPAVPIQPTDLIGRRVRLALAQAGGLNAQTIFRGVIDVPSINLQDGTIRCTCHDQAQEVWANTPREVIDALVGGRWHVAVSGEPADNFAYLLERIQSVGKSWALDVLQQPRVLDWSAAARSVTVRRADVIDDTLEVDLPSREQLRSRVQVRMQYRYPVHRARGIVAQYIQPLGFFLPVPGQKPSYQFLTAAMVEGAASRAPGWSLRSLSIENPPVGTWVIGENEGFYTIRASVAPALALGFTARHMTRWTQTVTEEYNLTVRWPALEALLGTPVAEQSGATLESRFEVPEWSSDETVEPLLSPPAAGDVFRPWRAPGADTADRDVVLRTLLDRAWVRLWAASRSARVRFGLPARPDLWLDTRVTLVDEQITAAGKINTLTHTLDIESGSATTDVEIAVGLNGSTAAGLPEWLLPESPWAPQQPPIGALSAQVGTYIGGLATSAPYDDEAMVGFFTNAEGIEPPGRNWYPHQLTIGWPAIDAADRDPLTLQAEGDYAVEIPTDQLEIAP